MANVLGIEHLKEPVKLIMAEWKLFIAAKADGKVDLNEVLTFMPPLLEIPEIIKDGKVISAEFADRTPEEIDELTNYAIAEGGESFGTARPKVVAILHLIAAGLNVQLAFQNHPSEAAATTPK